MPAASRKPSVTTCFKLPAPPEKASGGTPAGNPRRIAQALRDYVFDASRRVVEGHELQFRILRKQVAALIERDRVREHPPDIANFGARQCDQIVHNAQAKLAHDIHLAAE